jgi:hypothetical protein
MSQFNWLSFAHVLFLDLEHFPCTLVEIKIDHTLVQDSCEHILVALFDFLDLLILKFPFINFLSKRSSIDTLTLHNFVEPVQWFILLFVIFGSLFLSIFVLFLGWFD